MISTRSAFLIGVSAAMTGGVLGPYIGRNLRPWLRSALGVGLDVAERVSVRSAELLEDVEDLAAEARRQRERPGTERGTEAGTGPSA